MSHVFRVVIADDAAEVRARVKERLSEIPGVEVVGEACEASSACSLVTELKPDLVILDIQMPGGGGRAVLEKMREIRSATVAIVLSNYADSQYRRAYKSAGARGVFDKSAEFEDALEMLRMLSRKVLDRRTSNPEPDRTKTALSRTGVASE